MTQDTGGLAFPDPARASGHCMDPGMTLRDWFAGRATDQDIYDYQGEYTNGPPGSDRQFTRAQARYRFADAMLAERAATKTKGEVA